MTLDLSIYITYIGAIVLIFVLGKLFLWPLKAMLRMALNSVAGAILLFAINIVGGGFGFAIPLNVLNGCIVGILGLPGVIMLVLLTA